MAWPSVTKHLKALERAKLIRRERDGWGHRMHLEPQPLREAQACIEEHRALCARRFDALDALLAATTTQTRPMPKKHRKRGQQG